MHVYYQVATSKAEGLMQIVLPVRHVRSWCVLNVKNLSLVETCPEHCNYNGNSTSSRMSQNLQLNGC